MSGLKYTVISSAKQYNQYTKILEELVFAQKKTAGVKDEIDLLTLLIEKYDETHSPFRSMDPIRILLALMADHQMKPQDLVNLLGVSKGYISDILHYKKGLSKEMIRNLSTHFKVRQEAFNRPYPLAKSATRLKKVKQKDRVS
jgi:HTH-type transcriptional regulator/antitoxin HigA